MDDFLTEINSPDFTQAARAYTRRFANTFYFASFMLPRAKREAAYEVYAFCRYADNLLDDDPEIADRVAQLDRLRLELEKVYKDPEHAHPRLAGFSDIVRRYRIPMKPFSALLDGVETDLKIHRYESWEQLELYCYRVASTVGLIMSHIFGVSSEEAYPHAVELGKAMQLTNILRDVREDWERGRVYLPADELVRFRCSEGTLDRGEVSPAFIELMKFEIQRARTFYRRAERGIAMLTNDGSRFCVRVMSALYERILDVIERRRYDVFRYRAAVSLAEKLIQVVKLKLVPDEGETVGVEFRGHDTYFPGSTLGGKEK